MRFLVLNFAAGLCIVGASCSKQTLATTSDLPEPQASVVMLTAEGLEESSGVAPSLTETGWYYTHNDDDNPMRYWKFNLQGKVLGPYVLPNIVNRDVEDMSAARIDGKSFLYFADIGDNLARYESVRIYRVEEPTSTKGDQRKVDVFTLRYPSGPMNSEAFFVDPLKGSFWIIEKTTQKKARVLRCMNPMPGNNTMEEIGTVEVGSAIAATRLITSAAISTDTKRVVLRTYVNAFEFATASGLKNWWNQTPKTVTLNVEGQGEAICYSKDVTQIITTSEGKPCQVSFIAMKSD
jgi:hypothetical protein